MRVTSQRKLCNQNLNRHPPLKKEEKDIETIDEL
jgi:hypothetical protein